MKEEREKKRNTCYDRAWNEIRKNENILYLYL